eukprot:2822085-Pleurochrysis_carterae.AAC.2
MERHRIIDTEMRLETATVAAATAATAYANLRRCVTHVRDERVRPSDGGGVPLCLKVLFFEKRRQRRQHEQIARAA